MKEVLDIKEWFDIIYPQPDPNRKDDPNKDLLWTRKNIQKFINFIEENQGLFESQQAKRKSKVYTIAAEYMGHPFKNITMRRRFDGWYKKYETLENLIKQVKRNIWLSNRNQKIFTEAVANVKQLNQKLKQAENSEQTLQLSNSYEPEQQFFFSIKNGVINFNN